MADEALVTEVGAYEEYLRDILLATEVGAYEEYLRNALLVTEVGVYQELYEQWGRKLFITQVGVYLEYDVAFIHETGRTAAEWVDFIIGAPTTLRAIPIDGMTAVGVVYGAAEFSEWQDAVKGYLPLAPDVPIEITGPYDTTALAAEPALSGSHTVLERLAGGLTPFTILIKFGMRHDWVSGEPVFGIESTATDGYLCFAYNFDPMTMRYTAKFKLFAGSDLPVWGSARA